MTLSNRWCSHLHIRPDAFAVAAEDDSPAARNLGLEQNSAANLQFLNGECLPTGARL